MNGKSCIPQDTLQLSLGNLSTVSGLFVLRRPNDMLRNGFLELLDEGVVDAGLDVDPTASTAVLSHVAHDTVQDPWNSVVEVDVVKDNVRRLPSQLQSHLLQVRRSCVLQDSAANVGRSSEGDLVDAHVLGDGRSGNVSVSSDDIDDTSRETSLGDELSSHKGGQGGCLSGLDHHGAPASDGRTNLPSPHHQGEVPRNDLTAHTNLKSQVS